MTLVLTDNHPSLNAFGRMGFETRMQFPIRRIRTRSWLISLPPEEKDDFYIEKNGPTFPG